MNIGPLPPHAREAYVAMKAALELVDQTFFPPAKIPSIEEASDALILVRNALELARAVAA